MGLECANMKRLVPFFPLVFAGAVLQSAWATLPERWPVHWNARGNIDGWASKDPVQVAFPLLIGLVVVVIFELIASSLGAAFSAKMSPEAASRLATAHQRIVRTVSTGIAAFLSFVTLALPFGWGIQSILVAAGILVVGLIGVMVVSIKTTLGGLKTQGELPAGYTASGLYSDPNDPRLMVPKLSGLGLTVNLGHPMGKPLLGGIVLLTVVIALVAVSLTQK